MLEAPLVRLLGYGVFWSRAARHRFRANALEWIINLKRLIICSSLTTVPRSQGERLVERHISILGIPVLVRRRQRAKYHVALLVDEFFGGWDTAVGGYGALARKYICEFIPNDVLQIDVLLDVHNGMGIRRKFVDHTMLYLLPANIVERQDWLDNQGFDLFLSIEMTEPSFNIIRDYHASTPFLYWIQDPRELTMYQSRRGTVSRLRDGD